MVCQDGEAVSRRLTTASWASRKKDVTARYLGQYNVYHVYFIYDFIQYIFLAFFSPSLQVVPQIRGLIECPPPSAPPRYVPPFLSLKELSIFFSRRIARVEFCTGTRIIRLGLTSILENRDMTLISITRVLGGYTNGSYQFDGQGPD